MAEALRRAVAPTAPAPFAPRRPALYAHHLRPRPIVLRRYPHLRWALRQVLTLVGVAAALAVPLAFAWSVW